MITIRIIGGLGNQMFQYAYAKSLESNGYKVQIDISKLKKDNLRGYQLDAYKTDLKIAPLKTIILNKLGIIKSLKEHSMSFNKDCLDIKDNRYIKGYFQSEKYFLHIRSILLKQFSINTKLSSNSESIKQEIINNQQSTCSLHIRRGDYISNEKANKVHGVCSIKYYKQAINIINERENKEVKYFIFSDDMQWSKKNIKIKNAIYVENEKGAIPHEDILLMSLCANNITANSSFSWWGAWLNHNNDKIVVSPKVWFCDEKKNKESDILCKNWIQI